MVDNMMVPLINSNENKEENNNAINNERNNKQSIISYLGTINIKLNKNKKTGIVFLSFAIQLLIYFLLLKFLLNKFDFIRDHNTLLSILSLIIITTIYSKEGSLKKMSFIYLIIIALISSICFYFYLYKLCILLSFQIFTYLFLTSITMYLWLSFYYFFEFAEDMAELDLKTCILIFLCCLLIFIFEKIDFLLSLGIFIFVVILNFCSLNHVNDLIMTDNINTINRYLLLHMCLFMDINLTAFIFILLGNGEY